MKHLLIIHISFLLLSSPVIGEHKYGRSHIKKTIYRWGDTYPYDWKSVGREKIQPKYEGEVTDIGRLKPHGLGIMTYPNGDKYEGEWSNGKYHGQGTRTYPNGEKYEGEFKYNKRWNGILYDKYGSIIGKYVDGI